MNKQQIVEGLMRSFVRKVVVAVIALGLFAGATGVARADTLEVDVPFAFVVNGETLPAGHYRLEWHPSSASVLVISGKQGARAQVFLAAPLPGRPSGYDPVLLFTQYENTYQLIGVIE